MIDSIRMTVGFLILFIVVMVFGWFSSTIGAYNNCDRLSSYGYLAKVEGSFWDEGINCYVYMTDGTKIKSYDFSVADYKEPINVGNKNE